MSELAEAAAEFLRVAEENGWLPPPPFAGHPAAERLREALRRNVESNPVGGLIPEVDPVAVPLAVRGVREHVSAHLRRLGRPSVNTETFAIWFRRHAAEELAQTSRETKSDE